LIPEPVPRSKKRKTKKEAKIEEEIPKVPEKEVLQWQKTADVRNETREEVDNRNRTTIDETLWSEDEGPVTEPIHPQYLRPRRYKHVDFYNKFGEHFSGRVTHVHKKNDTIIWIRLDDTQESMQIDMGKIMQWSYRDKGKTFIVVQEPV